MARTREVKTPGEVLPEQKQEQPPTQEPTTGNPLPRAADIDPTKISRSVLTQDGWVCPA